MTAEQPTTTALIPVLERVLDGKRKPGVSARVLYDFLKLNPKVYARWVKKNITGNPYAIEHIDWEISLLEVEYSSSSASRGHFAQDYLLSIDFAKRLAMMARSSKGEEARQYFLDCEKAAIGQATLPTLKNPANQALIEALLRLDAFEEEQQRQRETQEAYQRALVTQQQAILDVQAKQIESLEKVLHASAKAERAQEDAAASKVKADEAEVQAKRADTKADMALAEVTRFTVENFILGNKLLDQFPPADHRRISDWLKDFCLSYGFEVIPLPVYGKPWPTENGYPIQAFSAWLRYEKVRPRQLRVV